MNSWRGLWACLNGAENFTDPRYGFPLKKITIGETAVWPTVLSCVPVNLVLL